MSESSYDSLLTFYSELLDLHIDGSADDLRKIALPWLKPTGASVAWIWLNNDAATESLWELIGDASSGATPILPPFTTFSKTTGLSDIALRAGRVVSLTNVQDAWYHEGVAYSSRFTSFMTDLGLPALDVIPFRTESMTLQQQQQQSSSATASQSLNLSGAICLHYGPEQRRVHSDDVFKLMAKLTAAAILRYCTTRQLQILVELNRLEAEAMRRRSPPRTLRKDYLSKVIRRLKQWVNCEGVSIFYRTHPDEPANCIGTTGLVDPSGNSYYIRKGDPPVSYAENEKHWTSLCLRTGEPFVRVGGAFADHSCKYREMLSGRDRRRAVIMVPIFSARDPSFVTGVMRCTGHTSPIYDANDRNFDPLECLNLQFAAQQISPILDTFAYQINLDNSISIIRHDLLNPFNIIYNCLDAIEDSVVPTVSRIALELNDARVQCDRGRELVMQLGPDRRQANHHDVNVPLQPVFLEGEIIARLKSSMIRVAQDKRMTIKFGNFRSASIPPVRAPIDDLERVFVNLLTNAIKYGTPSTEITITPRRATDGVHIEVSNIGVGVEAEEKERIFEPHFRGKKSYHQVMGSGLGLSISRDLMRQVGGDVVLTSLHKPTTFDVFFPSKLLAEKPR